MGKNKDISFLKAIKGAFIIWGICLTPNPPLHNLLVLVVSTREADYLAAFVQFDSFFDTCNKFIVNLIVFQGTSEYQRAWILNNS